MHKQFNPHFQSLRIGPKRKLFKRDKKKEKQYKEERDKRLKELRDLEPKRQQLTEEIEEILSDGPKPLKTILNQIRTIPMKDGKRPGVQNSFIKEVLMKVAEKVSIEGVSMYKLKLDPKYKGWVDPDDPEWVQELDKDFFDNWLTAEEVSAEKAAPKTVQDYIDYKKGHLPFELTLKSRFGGMLGAFAVHEFQPVRVRYTGIELDYIRELNGEINKNKIKGLWFKGTILKGKLGDAEVGDDFRMYYTFTGYNDGFDPAATIWNGVTIKFNEHLLNEKYDNI